MQDRIIALHNLDCPWTSANLIQRIGRAVRQGNMNELVHIYNYVTQGTFDAYMYQLRALDYAEIKALATRK